MKKLLSLAIIVVLFSSIILLSGCVTKPVIVEIEMEDGGIIKLELYPDIAPITVANFVRLANEGFYDGLIFHRVMSGFMIQGGQNADVNTPTITGEFSSNGIQNDIRHERGVISMARVARQPVSSFPNDVNSASTQFFIMHGDAPHLNGIHAAWKNGADIKNHRYCRDS